MDEQVPYKVVEQCLNNSESPNPPNDRMKRVRQQDSHHQSSRKCFSNTCIPWQKCSERNVKRETDKNTLEISFGNHSFDKTEC